MLAAAPEHLFEEKSDRNRLLAALFGTTVRVEKLPETLLVPHRQGSLDFRPLTGGEIDESRRLGAAHPLRGGQRMILGQHPGRRISDGDALSVRVARDLNARRERRHLAPVRRREGQARECLEGGDANLRRLVLQRSEQRHELADRESDRPRD